MNNQLHLGKYILGGLYLVRWVLPELQMSFGDAPECMKTDNSLSEPLCSVLSAFLWIFLSGDEVKS